ASGDGGGRQRGCGRPADAQSGAARGSRLRRAADGDRSVVAAAGRPPRGHAGGSRSPAGNGCRAGPGAAGLGSARARRGGVLSRPGRHAGGHRERLGDGGPHPRPHPARCSGAARRRRHAPRSDRGAAAGAGGGGGLMDYARFVRLRRPVWEAFETQLAAVRDRWRGLSYGELEEMALRYRQVLHDHALAAARFPGTAAARRLQSLAVEGTRRLTGERGERAGLRRFFSRTFPRAFQRQLDVMGVALALFLLATLWGLIIAVLRPGLGMSMLGPQAVQKLEEGELWTNSLVTTVPPAVSSSGIATNNISVALSAWSGGLLAGVVPLY